MKSEIRRLISIHKKLEEPEIQLQCNAGCGPDQKKSEAGENRAVGSHASQLKLKVNRIRTHLFRRVVRQFKIVDARHHRWQVAIG